MKKMTMMFMVMVLLVTATGTAQTRLGGEDPQATAAWFGSGLTVMTRNVYVGANVDLLMGGDLSALDQVLNELFITSFPDRARGLAKEISVARPHLIGLQEISIIRGNLPEMGAFEMNYLDILMMTLDAYGLKYRIVGQIENFDVSIPLMPGTNYFAQLVDFDVVLARQDVQIEDADTVAETYQAYLPLDSLGTNIYRGYVAVTARVGGKAYRFVSTHLESVPKDYPEIEHINLAQAQELLGKLQSETLPTIVVGDLNSVAKIGMSYQEFLAAGFVDAWKRNLLRRNRKGYTYGHASDLRNPTVDFYERIDYVMVRSNIGISGWQVIGPVFAWVVGDELKDRVWVEAFQEFIWPSDHGGVVARLRIPKF
ncbi:MAG: endonuclease/exonuclease/phosphatase family protein [Candidatus Aminicenantaceae bacterium]